MCRIAVIVHDQSRGAGGRQVLGVVLSLLAACNRFWVFYRLMISLAVPAVLNHCNQARLIAQALIPIRS